MTCEDDASPGLANLLNWHDGVLRVEEAMKYLTREALRWRARSGRWQQPCRGIVVAQSGPLIELQALRIAALWAGPGGALAGLTAASLDGLQGFTDRGQLAERPIHVLVPAPRPARRRRPSLPLVVHYSRLLSADDIHPLREPRRTRMARSLVDALSELDLTRLIRRYRLPPPDRQAPRRDSAGRRRWLDAVWEAAGLIIEVDGRHHMDAAQY